MPGFIQNKKKRFAISAQILLDLLNIFHTFATTLKSYQK